MLYRHRYLTKDKFDNFYVTKEMEVLDARREEMKKDAIFPLKGKESRRYVTISKKISSKACC